MPTSQPTATIEQLLSLSREDMLSMTDDQLDAALGPILQDQETVLSKLPSRQAGAQRVSLQHQQIKSPVVQAAMQTAMAQAGLTPEALRALGIKV